MCQTRLDAWEEEQAAMARFGRSAGIGGIGMVGLALLGVWLVRDHQARHELACLDDGRRLYWQQRRTVHVHEPYELINQLYHRTEDDDAVLDLLALAPGSVVADVGCGSGFYTFEIASMLGPEGLVYGVDIQAESLAFLQERIDALGCPGCAEIRLVHNHLDDVALPAASVDVMLMAHLDFYAYRPMLPPSVRMVESSVAALRPGGLLVVVQDMRPVPGGLAEHIERNLVEAGLTLERSGTFEDGTVLASFRKPGEVAER